MATIEESRLGWSQENTAASYANTVQSLTSLASKELIEKIHSQLPLGSESQALDNGCGSGVVSSNIKNLAPDTSVLATDISPAMIDMVQKKADQERWKNFRSEVVDGSNLAFLQSNSFTHAFSTFVFGVAPAPANPLMLDEMCRVVSLGGSIGIAIWNNPYFFFKETWEAVARELYPDYEMPPITDLYWSNIENLASELKKRGVKNVEISEGVYHLNYKSASDLTDYLFDGGNPLMASMFQAFDSHYGKMERLREPFLEELRRRFGDAPCDVPFLIAFATATK